MPHDPAAGSAASDARPARRSFWRDVPWFALAAAAAAYATLDVLGFEGYWALLIMADALLTLYRDARSGERRPTTATQIVLTVGISIGVVGLVILISLLPPESARPVTPSLLVGALGAVLVSAGILGATSWRGARSRAARASQPSPQ